MDPTVLKIIELVVDPKSNMIQLMFMEVVVYLMCSFSTVLFQRNGFLVVYTVYIYIYIYTFTYIYIEYI